MTDPREAQRKERAEKEGRKRRKITEAEVAARKVLAEKAAARAKQQ